MIAYALDIVTLADVLAVGTPVDSIVDFQWSERMSDVGDLKLTVAYDASCVASLTTDALLRLSLAGDVVWFGVIQRRIDHPISQGEEAAQNPEFEGKHWAVLNDAMAVRPRGGFNFKPWSPTRVETFASPEFDITPGTPATELGAIGEPSTYWTGLPTGFPALDVHGIGPSSGDDTEAPEGYWYTALDWELDADSAIAQFSTADNEADIYANGFLLDHINGGEDGTQGFRSTLVSVFFASAGTHTTAAKIVNRPFGGGDPGTGEGSTLAGNPTRYVTVGFKVDANGRLGDRVFQSSGDWHNFEYPTDPPGLTFGHIARIDIDENQTDGIFADLIRGFNDINDSNLNPWDEIESVSRQVGDSFLKELVDWGQVYCDWRMSLGGCVLEAYRHGEMGSDSGVSYVLDANPDVSAVQELERDQQGRGSDCLIVTYKGGQLRYPDTGGTRIGLLELPTASALEAKTRAAEAIATPNPEEIRVSIAPTGTGDVPGVDWRVGDTIHLADGEGGTISERVIEWGGTITDDGPEFTVTVKDRQYLGVEALNRVIQSFANGSQGGTQPSGPSGDPPRFTAHVRSDELTFQPLPDADNVFPIGLSPEKVPHESCNLYAVAVTATPAGTGDTTFEFLLDGVDVLGGGGVLPSGEDYVLLPLNGNSTAWLQAWVSRVSVNLTAVGTGITGLLIEPVSI